MGDTDAIKDEISTEAAKDTQSNTSKPSIDILKEVKPSENIAIKPSDNIEIKPSSATSFEHLEEKNKLSETTVTEKPSTVEALQQNEEIKKTEARENMEKKIEKKEGKKEKGKKVEPKNHSDIFCLNKDETAPASIYSIEGSPSKNFFSRESNSSYTTTISTDTIKSQNSTASRQSQLRNPLTGIGVNSNDEFKNKPSKRRDGNPILGTGYKDESVTQTGQRIPPGGFSKGLW